MSELFIPGNEPKLPNGKPKKRFEVRTIMKDGGLQNAVFIDDELLDWAVDMESLREAMKMGPKYFNEIQKDIARHYVDSVSEVLGRQVTAKDIDDARKTGWI